MAKAPKQTTPAAAPAAAETGRNAIAAAAVAADQVAATQDGDQGAAEFSGYAEGIDLTGKAIEVRARSDRGRRRAGFGFTREPTRFEAEELTEDQLGAILADPELTVTIA